MSDPIQGWKSIAAYFDRGIRTVQGWERELGLPVHRLQKRVLAYPHELEEWRRRHEVSVLPEAEDVEEAPAKPRRPRISAIAAVLVLVALVAIGSVRLLTNHGPVAGIRVVQNALMAVGPDGREVWRHVFPHELESARYQPGGRGGFKIADLDNNGDVETLFVDQALDRKPADHLVCFDSRGRIRWDFPPGRAVTDLALRQYPPPYFISNIAIVPERKAKTAKVIVTSNHNWSFPNQVAVLDGPTGRLLSEYWHRGHLYYILVADLNGDGEPEVLLGGVNDAPEYARATLVVFDHRQISGASAGRDGKPQFQGMSQGSEKAIVRFPRTPLSAGVEFNRVNGLDEVGGHVVVEVAEGMRVTDPFVVYELDRTLHPVNVGFSDDFLNRYLQTQAKDPKLPSREVLAEQLRRGVEVWWRH
jgi:hypothetical protein